MQGVRMMTALGCLTGCGSLVDQDYAGEPMVRLQGLASANHADPIDRSGVRAAALWQSGDGSGVTGFTPLPLAVEFPTLWVDLLAAPHDELMFQLGPDEPALAEGYLHIVKPGTGTAPLPGDFLATELAHVLVYVTAPPAAGSVTASYLGGTPDVGFHVLVRTAVTELTAPQQLLVERCIAALGDRPIDVARAGCTAQHLYRLDAAPADLGTLLHFSLVAGG